jgi:outer membrane phospholipase A
MCALPLALIAAGSLAGAEEITSTPLEAPELTLRTGTIGRTVPIQLRVPAEAGEIVMSPSRYVRREYVAMLPGGAQGLVTLGGPGVPANPVAGEAQTPQVVAAAPEAVPQPTESEWTKDAFDPQAFFKEQFFGYEPVYFIAGTKSPNAKFQLSFKYRLFSERGSLMKDRPALKEFLTGFHLAYTQTSLWDWQAPSAPFLDSSYKPEFLYEADRVDRGLLGKWGRLDLQGGVQHESNGKGGADSRSLNIAYLQTTFVAGKEGGFQLSLAPRAWIYLGSLSDNPDIKKYRGHIGLRTIVGWADWWQLSATGLIGDAWDRGSLQLDLTYPLMALFSENVALYLYVQYFWGYGETLLHYNDRTSSLRVGFALFR